VSVGFYHARDYLPLLEFGAVRRGGGPKTLILSDEEMDALAGLPMLRDAMCSGETSVGSRGYESGAFRLDVTRIRRTARVYVNSQYISLNLQDIDYLSRMFSVVQQQLRDFIVALQDVAICNGNPNIRDIFTLLGAQIRILISLTCMRSLLLLCKSHCKV